MKTTPEIESAMAFMGARLADTGGGCTAWEFDHGETTTLITRVDDACAPFSLEEPCRVGFYDNDTGRLEENRNDTTQIFPTVLEALRDIYGREEGSDWPKELAS